MPQRNSASVFVAQIKNRPAIKNLEGLKMSEQPKSSRSIAKLTGALLGLSLLASQSVFAGFWGQEGCTDCKWGQMYWGANPNNPDSDPPGQATAPTAAPTFTVASDTETLTLNIDPYNATGDYSDGYSPVTQYVVACDGLDPVTFDGTNTLVLEGLEPGTDYNCSVTAVNDVGESSPALQVVTTDSLNGLNIILLCAAIDCGAS